MPRALILLLLSFSIKAAIWPPSLDAYTRVAAQPIAIADVDRPVWTEYGLEESERASYVRAGRTTKIVTEAWRLKDSTSAVAASQWLRGLAPAGAVAHAQGNYVLVFVSGYKPTASELIFWTNQMPSFRHGPSPTLPSFLPQENRLAGRDRFVLGPASLQAFLPAVDPKAASFEAFLTEAQTAEYRVKGSADPVRAAIFRFPTPAIAKGQLKEFAKVEGAKVKRSGPTIALLIPAPGQALPPAAEEQILKGIEFDIDFAYTDTMPTRMPDVGGMLVAIFQLTGVVVIIGAGGGLLAGFLFYSRRTRGGKEGDPAMTTLKLGR